MRDKDWKVAVKCWFSDDGEEPTVNNVDVTQNLPAYQAAEDYAQRHHADQDYAEEMRVSVRVDDGELIEFDVEAEQIIEFHACKVRR